MTRNGEVFVQAKGNLIATGAGWEAPRSTQHTEASTSSVVRAKPLLDCSPVSPNLKAPSAQVIYTNMGGVPK